MSRRRLDPDEHELWKGATREVAPLRRSVAAKAPELAARPGPIEPKAKTTPKVTAKTTHRPIAPAPPPVPALAPLGRRFRQRLARGSEGIDARLDLHGMTQAQAHDALLGFLRSSQARGARTVLVITGKGARGDDNFGERGVLKRQVPMWLRLPEFRLHVVGIESAGIGHGGEGALYVRLRRARGD
jgi:DNA-nicking Smr family endonuclease